MDELDLGDHQNGYHLRARRSPAVHDVFELQDQVCAQVVAALLVKLTDDEARRLKRIHTSSLEAYESLLCVRTSPLFGCAAGTYCR